MDWRRAKNILLAILVLLNIFLFINVMSVKDPFNITGKYQKDAKRALQAAGVIITGSIPTYAPVGRISFNQSDPALYAGFIRQLTGVPIEVSDGGWPYDQVLKNGGDTLTIQGDHFIYTSENNREEFPSENLKKLDQSLKGWIRDKVGIKEVFIQDGLVQSGKTINVDYVRKHKNLPLFSQRISLTLVEGRLTRMEGSIKILYAIKVSKAADEIISPNIVLLTGKDKVQGIVTSIDLGYLSLQGDDLYDTPVWRITLSSGHVVWFNAYTGEFLEYGTKPDLKTSNISSSE